MLNLVMKIRKQLAKARRKARAKVSRTRQVENARHYEMTGPEETYFSRNLVLRMLGFGCYGNYLRSKVWRRLRAKILQRHNKCRLCGDKATVVHHRDYSVNTLLGRTDLKTLLAESLVPICDLCHTLVEFDGNRKRPLSEVKLVTLNLLQRARRVGV